jgi:predicted permease
VSRLRQNLSKLNNLFRNNRADEELAREVASHLILLADDFERRGMSPEEARMAAKRAYGGVEQAKQAHRDERSLLWIEQTVQDLRYALRMLAKSPGFATVAILTLALGVGANTAIFSVIDAVMLRSVPAEDPQRLVIFSWSSHHDPKLRNHSDYGDCDNGGKSDCSFSVPFYEALRSQMATFSGVAAFAGPREVGFSGNGPATIERGEYVSGDYFSTVGAKAILGRPLGLADDAPTASPVIVLDYGFWQRAFGADPSAVGRTVRLNNVEAAIVGVAEPGFISLTPGKSQDFFMPLSLAERVRGEWWGTGDRLSDPASFWVVLAGRLKPGVSIEQAQAEATTLFHAEVLHAAKPIFSKGDAPALRLLPAREALNGESSQIAAMLELIMTAVGFVLLIACANVAGLILARSANRQKELAVRQALGAGRARIVRQLLTESLLLATCGGALGILVAVWGVRSLTRLMSSGLDRPFPFVIAPDWRVLAFTSGVTLATGILCGLAPSFRSGRADLTPSLRENASSISNGASQGGPHVRPGDALVVAQVALSVVVLVGAGLLVRTLHNLQTLDPGFNAQNVLLFGIHPGLAGYKDRQTVELYRQLQDRFKALPGVVSASYSEDALLSGGWSANSVHLDGAPPKSNVNAATLRVGLDFFRTMRIPVLAGRVFTPADFASAEATNAVVTAAKEAAAPGSPATAAKPQTEPQPAPEPVLVNQAFARKFFPNQNPVGLHMGNMQRDDPATGPQPGYLIVGIAGDTKYSRLRRDIMPTMFLPLVGNSAEFELRSSGDPTALVKQVRAIVSQADNNLPLFDVRTQTQQIEQALYQERLMSRLSSFFGFLALIMACIGLYGLLSYEVARRTRELGIRMALGAQRSELMRLVVRRGLVLALAGAVIGIGAAIAVTRLMAAMLYSVRPYDPATFGSACILLVVVALAACSIPARRAMCIDPMVALRDE